MNEFYFLFLTKGIYMRKLLIAIALATTPFMSTTASENECLVNTPPPVHQQFTYVDFGVGPFPVFFPSIKLGYRAQHNHHGIDVALQGTSFYPAFSYVKGSMAYQHYFCPNLCSQIYVGLGGAVGKVFYDSPCKSIFFASPEVTVGKQYTNECGKVCFVQLQINSPIYHAMTFKPILSNYRSMYTPCITLSYGIGF